MTFKTTPVTIPLYGHGLETVGSIDHEPIVTGTFAADPVTGNDGTIFGVFTVPDPTNGKDYPSQWAGTYRISAGRLQARTPYVFEEV